jgi:hypothetical protein
LLRGSATFFGGPKGSTYIKRLRNTGTHPHRRGGGGGKKEPPSKVFKNYNTRGGGVNGITGETY